MIESILVVCVGNICRSPAAEKIFQHKLSSKISVSSAGLGAVVGHDIDQNMQQCLIQAGYTKLDHQARQFTGEMAQRSDLILAMEKSHIQQIVRIVPHAHGKSMLLGKWAGDIEIVDPYKKSTDFFQQVYMQIEQQVDEWTRKLG